MYPSPGNPLGREEMAHFHCPGCNHEFGKWVAPWDGSNKPVYNLGGTRIIGWRWQAECPRCFRPHVPRID